MKIRAVNQTLPLCGPRGIDHRTRFAFTSSVLALCGLGAFALGGCADESGSVSPPFELDDATAGTGTGGGNPAVSALMSFDSVSDPSSAVVWSPPVLHIGDVLYAPFESDGSCLLSNATRVSVDRSVRFNSAVLLRVVDAAPCVLVFEPNDAGDPLITFSGEIGDRAFELDDETSGGLSIYFDAAVLAAAVPPTRLHWVVELDGLFEGLPISPFDEAGGIIDYLVENEEEATETVLTNLESAMVILVDPTPETPGLSDDDRAERRVAALVRLFD